MVGKGPDRYNLQGLIPNGVLVGQEDGGHDQERPCFPACFVGEASELQAADVLHGLFKVLDAVDVVWCKKHGLCTCLGHELAETVDGCRSEPSASIEHILDHGIMPFSKVDHVVHVCDGFLRVHVDESPSAVIVGQSCLDDDFAGR